MATASNKDVLEAAGLLADDAAAAGANDLVVAIDVEDPEAEDAIAAHYLRLAAAGHYTEPLIRLRTALLCEDDGNVVDAALQSALALGATSGADAVSGLVAGLLAWLPPAASASPAR